MAVRKLVPKDSTILRTACPSVEDFVSARSIVQDLIDTIDYLKTTYAFARGIGLAAPQIGKQVRVSVVEHANRQRYILINPKIIEHTYRKKPIREGCISFLEYRAMVPRYPHARVLAHNLEGVEYVIDAQESDFTMLLQHEIDHLDGILYPEHLQNGERDMFLV